MKEKAVFSNTNELVWNDIKRWLKNLFIFSSGSIIVFLTAIQAGADWKTAAYAVYPALINAVIDIVKKYKAETKYFDGQSTSVSDPIGNLGQ